MTLKVYGEPALVEEATAYIKVKTSRKLSRRSSHCTKIDIFLSSSFLLAKGARIMSIKNEDTLDGLVHDAICTLMYISFELNSFLPDITLIFIMKELELMLQLRGSLMRSDVFNNVVYANMYH